MLWDADYFYVGAELREPHVWGTLTAHDSVIFHDPDFEVFIDPNGDNHEYYEFEINALGTSWDLFLPKPYKDDGKPMNAWEIPGLKSAVFVDGTAERSARYRSRLERGDRVSMARAGRAGAASGPAGGGRSVARELLARSVAVRHDDREVRETEGRPRGQLGLVAAARRGHAPA